MEKEIFVLKELNNPRLLSSSEQGLKIQEIIIREFNLRNSVLLNFEGEFILISHFLNICIGDLFRDYDQEFISKNLKIIGLLDDDYDLLYKKVIPTAIKHFTKDEDDE